MSKLILMLGHQARVGKDTLADQLEHKAGFTRIAFADKLKEVCMDLYDLSYEQMYGDLKNVPDERFFNKDYVDDFFYTPRQILQYVGQSLFTIDPSIWVKYACKKVAQAEKVVFTDFRFAHEVDAVKKYFASDPDMKIVTVKITRDGIESFTGSNDRSEIELSEYPWDFIISNNGTIDELYDKGLAIVRTFV